MTESDWILLFALVTLFTMGVLYSINVIRTDTYANQKRLTRFVVFAYLTSFVAYLLSIYYFRVDQRYQVYVMAAILLMIGLPASLFSASVATITAGNI